MLCRLEWDELNDGGRPMDGTWTPEGDGEGGPLGYDDALDGGGRAVDEMREGVGEGGGPMSLLEYETLGTG